MVYFNFIEQILISALILVCIGSFSWELSKRFKLVLKGEGTLPFDNIPARLWRVFEEFLLQKKVLQQRFIPGLMHAFVFGVLLHLRLSLLTISSEVIILPYSLITQDIFIA